ncbi:MAG: hypothetical protein KDB14_20900 [Planctomycetales bacterium]|nr:hypothetical protein [Planctomycetales bacterium]
MFGIGIYLAFFIFLASLPAPADGQDQLKVEPPIEDIRRKFEELSKVSFSASLVVNQDLRYQFQTYSLPEHKCRLVEKRVHGSPPTIEVYGRTPNYQFNLQKLDEPNAMWEVNAAHLLGAEGPAASGATLINKHLNPGSGMTGHLTHVGEVSILDILSSESYARSCYRRSGDGFRVDFNRLSRPTDVRDYPDSVVSGYVEFSDNWRVIRSSCKLDFGLKKGAMYVEVDWRDDDALLPISTSGVTKIDTSGSDETSINSRIVFTEIHKAPSKSRFRLDAYGLPEPRVSEPVGFPNGVWFLVLGTLLVLASTFLCRKKEEG